MEELQSIQTTVNQQDSQIKHWTPPQISHESSNSNPARTSHAPGQHNGYPPGSSSEISQSSQCRQAVPHNYTDTSLVLGL